MPPFKMNRWYFAQSIRNCHVGRTGRAVLPAVLSPATGEAVENVARAVQPGQP